MSYPKNYDFGKKWNKKIKSHLDNPIIKKAIRKGVNDYLKNFPTKRKYVPNTIPADYSSKDAYMMIIDRKREELLEELRESNSLPKKFLRLEKKMRHTDDCEELATEHLEMMDKILNPYFTWDKVKYDLETYYLSGACHWYAPTFELELAKLVEPNENWYVRSGEDHTTVINEDETKLFDLLYWCDGDRFDNYLFGDPIKKKDPTRGGKAAYIDSS